MADEQPKALDPTIIPPGMESAPAFKAPRLNRTQQAQQMAIAGLVASGLNGNQVAKVLGISSSTAYAALKRLDGNGNQISSIKTAERDERLLALIDGLMEKGQKVKNIRASDALSAAKLYADRAFPVIREDSRRDNFSFVKVDISVYERGDYGPQEKECNDSE